MSGATKNVAEEHIQALLQADALPAATRVDSSGSGTRVLVTFLPFFDVVLTRAVTYEVRMPMAYPATPPVVRCLDEAFIAEHGPEVCLDASGRPQLSMLTIENMGWSKGYTLIDVVHVLRRTLVRNGPVVRVIPPPGSPPASAGGSERERRFSLSSPAGGEPGFGRPPSRSTTAERGSGHESADASASTTANATGSTSGNPSAVPPFDARPNSASEPRAPIRRASSAGLSEALGSARSRPGSARSSGFRSPKARPVPRGDLVPLASGHFGLQGRRPTMEDNAVWFDAMPVKSLLTGRSRPGSAFTTDASPLNSTGGTDGSGLTPPHVPNTIGFFGVFDGHGGSTASDFAATRLHELVATCLARGQSVAEALFHAFVQIDHEFERLLLRPPQQPSPDSSISGTTSPFASPRLTPLLGPAMPATSIFGTGLQGVGGSGSGVASAPSAFGGLGDFDSPDALLDQSGCTAVAAVFVGPQGAGGTLTVASAGDSRAVLCRNGTAVEMSKDHKTKRHDERARILAAGGIVFRGRVLGRLAVTRAIGDLPLKRGANDRPLVTAEPEIFETPVVPDDEFLILACDGVYDVIDSQTAVDIVRAALAAGKSSEEAAKTLADRAYALGSQDNISAVVVKIARGPPKDAANAAATSAVVGVSDATSGDALEKLVDAASTRSQPASSAQWPAGVITGATEPGRGPASTSADPNDPAPSSSSTPAPAAPPKKKDRGPNPFAKSARTTKGAPGAATAPGHAVTASAPAMPAAATMPRDAADEQRAVLPTRGSAPELVPHESSSSRPRGRAGASEPMAAGALDALDAALGLTGSGSDEGSRRRAGREASADAPAPTRSYGGTDSEHTGSTATWHTPGTSMDDSMLEALMGSSAVSGRAAGRYAGALGDPLAVSAPVRLSHALSDGGTDDVTASAAGGSNMQRRAHRSHMANAGAAMLGGASSLSEPANVPAAAAGSGPAVRRINSRTTMDTSALQHSSRHTGSTPPSATVTDASQDSSGMRRVESFQRPKGRRPGAGGQSEAGEMDALGRALAGMPLGEMTGISADAESQAAPADASRVEVEAPPARTVPRVKYSRGVEEEPAHPPPGMSAEPGDSPGYHPSFGGSPSGPSSRSPNRTNTDGASSARSPAGGRRASLDSATTLIGGGLRARAPSPALDAMARVLDPPGGDRSTPVSSRRLPVGEIISSSGTTASGARVGAVPALASSSVSKTLGTVVSAISAGGTSLYAAYGFQQSMLKSSQKSTSLAHSAPPTPASGAAAASVDFPSLPRSQYPSESDGKLGTPRSSHSSEPDDGSPYALPPRGPAKPADGARARSDVPARAMESGASRRISGRSAYLTLPMCKAGESAVSSFTFAIPVANSSPSTADTALSSSLPPGVPGAYAERSPRGPPPTTLGLDAGSVANFDSRHAARRVLPRDAGGDQVSSPALAMSTTGAASTSSPAAHAGGVFTR